MPTTTTPDELAAMLDQIEAMANAGDREAADTLAEINEVVRAAAIAHPSILR